MAEDKMQVATLLQSALLLAPDAAAVLLPPPPLLPSDARPPPPLLPTPVLLQPILAAAATSLSAVAANFGGVTALHIAAAAGDAAMVQVLVDAAGVGLVSAKDKARRTPLHHAAAAAGAARSDVAALRTWLLAPLRADVVSCEERSEGVGLSQAGGDLQRRGSSCGLRTGAHAAAPALSAAAAAAGGGTSAGAVAAAAGEGTEPDTLSAEAEADASLEPAACMANAGECVAALLRHGARADAKDRSGRTPLHVAAALGNADAARALLGARGAAAKPVKGGHREVVAVLLGAGGLVDAPDERGVTPLTAAAVGGDAELLMTLLAANQAKCWAASKPQQQQQQRAPQRTSTAAKRSRVGGVGGCGLSALHEAAAAGQTACVAALLHVSQG
ncbi:ankyrin repeat-containing domain protein [Tribonema minus]|uniref:Ankyrin repeat-containing domain protein n=1 Tax=Tribonema minus TaxID=303371 RepID=A0A835Z5Q5_9STRA|nr:ankyrin repeat-containing domain protein [Tribonema minus]